MAVVEPLRLFGKPWKTPEPETTGGRDPCIASAKKGDQLLACAVFAAANFGDGGWAEGIET